MKTKAILLLTLASLGSIPALCATLNVSSPVAVGVGTPLEVDVSIDLDPGESLFAYQMDVAFPLLLQATGGSSLGYFGTNGLGASVTTDNVNGIVQISDSLSGSDLLMTSDTLFALFFNTISTGTGEVSIVPPPGLSFILIDGNFNDVQVNAIGSGSVQVNTAGSATPEPASLLMLSAGGAAFLLRRLRRRP